MSIQFALGCVLVLFTLYRTISYYRQQRFRAATSPQTVTVEDHISSRLFEVIYSLMYGVALYSVFFTILPLWVIVSGLGCMVLAWLLRQKALRDLGKNYGHEIKLFAEHELVQHGIYKRMRHPLYLGLCIDTFGAAIISFSVIGTVLLVVFLVVIIRRIRLEDAALVKRFGDSARTYHQQVPAIRIWPLL